MPEIATKLKTYRFDQMAVQVKDKVHPDDADVDRYVGLEHIDPESLKIRRWGEPSDVESTKILFRAGDIIFGKRRAYQRKLAVADFDGICSAHAMVLRPKTDVVLKEFLLFFMQTDTFMERAVKISVGGLSPTINWKDLAKEEFALPPIEEQRRMVDVLSAVEQMSSTLEETKAPATTASRALCDQHFRDYSGSEESVSELALHISKGESPRWQGFGYVDHGIPFITSEHVLDGVIQAEECKQIPLAFHQKLTRSQIVSGDVLVTLVGASIGRAAVVPAAVTEANTNQAVAVVRFDTARMRPEYFVQWYLHASTQQHIAATLVNTARANVSLTDIRRMRMPVPPLVEQDALIGRTSMFRRAIEASRSRRDDLLRIKTGVLTDVQEAT